MQPTPAETLAGISRILADVITPDLRSDYARQRIREIRHVLDSVDWNDIVLSALRETAELAQLMVAVEQWTRREPARAQHFSAVSDAIAEALAAWDGIDGAVPAFEQLQAVRTGLDTGAADFLKVLRAWRQTHPASAESTRLKDQLSQIYLHQVQA